MTDFIKVSDIKIGTKFIHSHPFASSEGVHTVVDILTTYSIKDLTSKPVNVRYVSEYEYRGQVITTKSIEALTIQRGFIE